MSVYYNFANEYPLLTAEQELELGRRIQEDDDKTAKDLLVNSNVRLVLAYARKFGSMDKFEDLVQAGCEGLVRAASKYKPDRKLRFSTYAVPWIIHCMADCIADSANSIRLSVNLYMTGRKMLAYIAESQQRETPVTDEELAEKFNIPAKTVRSVLNCFKQAYSLDSAIDGEDDNTTFNDTVVDTNTDVANEAVDDAEKDNYETLVRNILTEREFEVFARRNGLFGYETMTCAEVGKLLKLSRQRVQQIEVIVRDKLQTYFVENDLVSGALV